MFNFKKSALVMVAMVSFTANCQPNSELQELLAANPVSQSDVLALGNDITASDSASDSSSDVSGRVHVATDSIIKNQYGESRDDGADAENDITKTLTSGNATYAPKMGSSLFVNNIPTNSTINFGRELMLTTTGTAMFFKGGVRVYKNPFIDNRFSTFCMLRFTPATTGRRIIANDVFVVGASAYKAIDKKMGLSDDKHIQILKINVKNKDLRQMVCYSGEMDRPMTIGDVSKIMGGGFKIGVEQYRDI